MNLNMKAYRFIYLTMILITLIGANISGCSALQPKTPGESALLAKYSLTGFYQSIATLRDAERITKEEGRELFMKAGQAEMSLKTAMIALDAGDKNTFQQNMLVANRLLMAIDQTIKSKQLGAPQ